MIKKSCFVVLFILSLSIFSASLWAEERYEPYPIIFVHGYNNVPERTDFKNLWKETYKEFEIYYFKEGGEGKYFIDKNEEYETENEPHKDWDYLQKFDYRKMSNGDIEDIKNNLKNYIDDVVKYTLPGKKEEDKKIIIVAHSMGGLDSDF